MAKLKLLRTEKKSHSGNGIRKLAAIWDRSAKTLSAESISSRVTDNARLLDIFIY